jgi:hypothetical protein
MSESIFEKLRERRAMLEAQGFKRVFLYLSSDSRRLIAARRQPGESPSATVNRLLRAGGGDPIRPDEASAEARRWERQVRSAQNQIRHSRRYGNNRGPITLSIRIFRPDGSGVFVTAYDVQELSKDEYERTKAADTGGWEVL